MLCTNCKKEKAVFFYSQTINGKESSLALCKNCAAKINTPSENFGIFEPFFRNSVSHTQMQSKKCNLCGLSFEEIRKLGKVGCPKCYSTFSEELSGIIREIHGSAKHCGNIPESIANMPEIQNSDEEILREQLNNAINSENYEEAAILRDKIKALKGEKNE